MAYDGWIEFNGQEFINLARSARLARALGLDTLRVDSELVATLEGRLLDTGFGTGGFGMGGFGGITNVDNYYADITKAPWYDPGYAASTEFVGVIPLSIRGLDDSTLEATPVEYITDGGHPGEPRNATLSIVANVALLALTERGAEYGKRWMDRVLRNSVSPITGGGSDFTYLRYPTDDSPVVHRRDVKVTRGSSVTRKKTGRCSSTWLATFTLTAGDPYEYGAAVEQVSSLGGATATGSSVVDQGSVDLVEASCPTYDYSPLYDPSFPALVPGPTVPTFLPDGWGITEGMTFRRKWAQLEPFEPFPLNAVPVFILTSSVDARMVRVAVWPSTAEPDDQCMPLFSTIISYLPAGYSFYVDGEKQVAYVWDGYSAAVRRTDSLVYGPDAVPLQWASLNDEGGFMVTLDVFAMTGGGFEGGGQVRAKLQFVPKSD